MRRALARLSVAPDHVLIDGKAIRSLRIAHTAVVHGDARCFSIACASIIAKVTRDRLMHSLARRHPAYRWDHNVGYATQDHIAGLATAGITPHHRRSFMRIRQLSFDFDAPPEVIVDIPIEAMMGDVSGETGAITTLEPEPNESRRRAGSGRWLTVPSSATGCSPDRSASSPAAGPGSALASRSCLLRSACTSSSPAGKPSTSSRQRNAFVLAAGAHRPPRWMFGIPSVSRSIMGQVANEHGRLDLLINNAAGNFYVPSESMSPNAWRSVIEIDLFGTFFCSQAVLPLMRASGGGSIVNISMTLHYRGWPQMAHATAAKGGIDALTRTLALEWASDAVRVNAVAPGPIPTEGVLKAFARPPDSGTDLFRSAQALTRGASGAAATAESGVEQAIAQRAAPDPARPLGSPEGHRERRRFPGLASGELGDRGHPRRRWRGMAGPFDHIANFFRPFVMCVSGFRCCVLFNCASARLFVW